MTPPDFSSPLASNEPKSSIILMSEHIRAARALLQWDQKTLAEKSNVSVATIKRLEPQPGPLKANKVTIAALRHALEAAGIEFIPENGGGPGVRMARRSSP
ncbi:helix-turn-helix domain-containing protein [Aquamicrobium defluvii]|uniref:helix-turn-helix domain-containing protein n=1 Tax=Aquamicrobium defluvii TaxID=69279 RepID=UPI001FDFB1FC|nr:transcriptional regulator [Aquamicrobium defluvii]